MAEPMVQTALPAQAEPADSRALPARVEAVERPWVRFLPAHPEVRESLVPEETVEPVATSERHRLEPGLLEPWVGLVTKEPPVRLVPMEH